MGFRAVRSVEVTSPVEVAFSGESYVCFAVRSRVSMASRAGAALEEAEWIVYHRYSEFEKFDSRLRTLVNEYLDANLILLPVLPPKPWIPQPQTNREFLESRARKLHRYVNAVVALPELLKRVQYLEVILSFLSEGESWNSAGSKGQISVASSSSASLLGKGILAANNGLSKLLDSRSPPSQKEDYDYVLNLFKKQGLASQQMKYAWPKLVVGIFGTTSSGKSSLVSHLFTLVCSSSSGAGQIDTGFSIFETVEGGEFCKFTQERVFPDFTLAELRAPLKPADQNLCGDRRYGFVFVYLTAEETLERYREQLAEDGGVLKRFSKIRTVLINEKYLSGTPEEVALAKKLILIDSKGIDASTFDASDERIWPEVGAMQFVAKISHLNLFLIPADSIRDCGPALSVFELTIVCSEEGLEVLKQQKRRSSKEGAGSLSSSPPSVDPFSGLFYRMLGVDGIVGAAKAAASSIANFLMPANTVSIESGTSRWQKTFFVLSQCDHVPEAKDQLFYELGIAFGSRLHYLQPPTFARVALLGLPEKQTGNAEPIVGFLNDFKQFLLRQSVDASYDSSRDDAIIQMAELLEKEMQTGWVSMAYFTFQGSYIKEAKARALARRFSVQNKV